MIRMISGYTHCEGKVISVKDGPVELPADIEARLVGLDVAEYVDSEPIVKGPAVDEKIYSEGEGEDTPPALMPSPPAGGTADEQEPDLSAMSLAELKELAENMGIDTKGMRSKAAVIAAIEAADKPPDPQVIE